MKRFFGIAALLMLLMATAFVPMAFADDDDDDDGGGAPVAFGDFVPTFGGPGQHMVFDAQDNGIARVGRGHGDVHELRLPRSRIRPTSSA